MSSSTTEHSGRRGSGRGTDLARVHINFGDHLDTWLGDASASFLVISSLPLLPCSPWLCPSSMVLLTHPPPSF